MKIELTEDWKRSLRRSTMLMHYAGSGAAMLFAFMPALPMEVQAMIPAPYRVAAVGLWAIGGVVANIIKRKHANG